MKINCISDKAKTKKVQYSIYKSELEKAKTRQRTIKAKAMKRKRSSTVEPVWDTLINFTGLKRLNTRGLQAANKMLLMAATVYNLKKWLKFAAPNTNIKAIQMVQTKYRKSIMPFTNHILSLVLNLLATRKLCD